MNEPANHTAWIVRDGTSHDQITWVRVDEASHGHSRRWFALDDQGQLRPGAVSWSYVSWLSRVTGGMQPATPEQTAQALARVRQEMAR